MKNGEKLFLFFFEKLQKIFNMKISKKIIENFKKKYWKISELFYRKIFIFFVSLKKILENLSKIL